MDNWFGLQRGKYIGEPPAYVDKLQKPGMTAGTLFCSIPVTYGCYLALKNV